MRLYPVPYMPVSEIHNSFLSTISSLPQHLPIHYPTACLLTHSLALERELGLTVRSHSTPGSLIRNIAVVTDGSRLPRLVESLEVESVEAPVEQGAEAVLVKVLSIVQTTFGVLVVGADCSRPAGLAVPDLGLLVGAAGYFLDVRDSLVHVVEVNVLEGS
jgi:hypothetical protein